MVETWSPLLRTERRWRASTRLQVEHDNFHDALDWCIPPVDEPCSEDRIRTGLRLCSALGEYWRAYGYFYSAGQQWLERAVERPNGRDSVELAHCLRHLSNYCVTAGMADRAQEYAASSVAMCRRLQATSSLVDSLSVLGFVLLEQDQTTTARSVFEEAVSIPTDPDDASHFTAVSGLAVVEGADGHHDVAVELSRQVLAASRRLADPYAILLDQQNLACSLLLSGRVTEAHHMMAALIPDALKLNVPGNLMHLAEDYAAILAELGDHPSAVRLLGAADLIRERSGTPRSRAQQAEIAAPLAKAHAAMHIEEWDLAYQQGRNTPLENLLS